MRIGLLLSCLLLGGCGSPEILHSAEVEPLDAFRAKLAERLAQEQLSPGEARDLAGVLLRREIESTTGPQAERGFAELAPCASLLDDALAKRCQADDALGARACLVRARAGGGTSRDLAELVTSPEPTWRAVGARALTEPEPPRHAGAADPAGRVADWRRKLMADPTAEVRLEAVRASGVAHDWADAPILLEVARLDPAPDVRAEALAVVGRVATAEAVRTLRDRWERADDEERVHIVSAWALAAEREPEARRQLERVIEVERGAAGVEAALELLGKHTPAEAPPAAVVAAAMLERILGDGPTRVRVAALERAPLDWPELRKAVVKARDDSDREVAAAAAARLLEVKEERDKALKLLREIAPEIGPAGERATRALVGARDHAALAVLDRNARSLSPSERSATVMAYGRLGELDRALRMLGDADARVRWAGACAVLRSDRAEP